MHNFRAVLTVFFVCALMQTLLFAAHAQSPIVINAVDNDPENRLWNCETNRVPFNNQDTDRSRCFTFRYAVPPEGITSATVHIALDTLGSLQDTDATIVAVSKPVENCAWGQGPMAGCVVLHGGFKGGEKSLNLNLLNITCDASVPNSQENQQLVRDALNSGVLHMLLEDDTAVYGAQLVLNGGAPSFTCGTSKESVAQVVATRASSAPTNTSGTTLSTANSTFFSRELTQILTGTTEPTPPNLPGATAASVAGALALAIFAASNYLIANPNFVQSAMEKATRRFSTRGKNRGRETRLQESAREATPPIESERVGARVDAARGDTSAVDTQAMRGQAVSDATINMSSGGAENAIPARTIDASGAVGIGQEISAGSEIGAVALDKAVKEGISSVPDASELVKDKLIEKAEQREKRERLRADKKRLEEKIAACEIRFAEVRENLKRAIDGGDFEGAQRAWRQAEHELNQTRAELEHVTKQLAALEEKKQEEG